ncbi:MAG: ABC-2 transporter permease [Lachnospiraceae bacterium]|nr:ABC-2 transporter permease [Lachnospiraceae bacterium]
MKGLFIKDLLILKSRKQLYIVVLALAVMYAVMGMHAFAMEFMALLGASSVISTLSYDFMDNGGTFLFALPFTRRQYIAEKYLISYGGGLVGMLLGSLVVLAGIAMGQPIAVDEIFTYIVVGVMITAFMVSFMIPLEIKFGAEQSRTAMFAVMAAVMIAAVIIARILPESVVARVAVYLQSLTDLQMGLGIGLFAVVFTTISVLLSLHFIQKKEF